MILVFKLVQGKAGKCIIAFFPRFACFQGKYAFVIAHILAQCAIITPKTSEKLLDKGDFFIITQLIAHFLATHSTKAEILIIQAKKIPFKLHALNALKILAKTDENSVFIALFDYAIILMMIFVVCLCCPLVVLHYAYGVDIFADLL